MSSPGMVSAVRGALLHCSKLYLSSDGSSMLAGAPYRALLPLASRVLATSLGPTRQMLQSAADAGLWHRLGCMRAAGYTSDSRQPPPADSLGQQLSPWSLLPAMRASSLGAVMAARRRAAMTSAEVLLATSSLGHKGEDDSDNSAAGVVRGLVPVIMALCTAAPAAPRDALDDSARSSRRPAAGRQIGHDGLPIPESDVAGEPGPAPPSDRDSALSFLRGFRRGIERRSSSGSSCSTLVLEEQPDEDAGAQQQQRERGRPGGMQQQQQADSRHTLAEAVVLLMLEPMCRAAVSDLEAAGAVAAAADLAVRGARAEVSGDIQTWNDLSTAIIKAGFKTRALAAHVEMSAKSPLLTVAAASQAAMREAATHSPWDGSDTPLLPGQQQQGAGFAGGEPPWSDLPLLSGQQQRSAAGPHLAVLYGLSHAGVPELLAAAGVACRGLLDRSAQLARLHVELTNSDEAAVAEAKRGGGGDGLKIFQNNTKVVGGLEADTAASTSAALVSHLSRLYPSALASFEALASSGAMAAQASGQRAAECVESQLQRPPFAASLGGGDGGTGASPSSASGACVEALASSQRLVESCGWLAELLGCPLLTGFLLAPEPAMVLQPCLLTTGLEAAAKQPPGDGGTEKDNVTWQFGGQLMGMLVGRLLSHLTLVAEEVHELVEACRPGLDAGGDSRGSSQVQPGGEAVGSGEAALAVEAARAVDAAFSCLEDVALSAELSAVALAKLLFLSSQLDTVLEAGLGPCRRLGRGDDIIRRLCDMGLKAEDKGEQRIGIRRRAWSATRPPSSNLDATCTSNI